MDSVTTTRSRYATAAIPRRGAALMMVMVVVAIATVLGFAMVSASSLQSMTTGNLRRTATAEYLAESGAQLALYYLQNPTASPVAKPNGYYPGQTGLRVDNSVPGSVDVSVTLSNNRYTITSVGRADTADGTAITKTVTGVAEVVSQFKQLTAGTFAYDVRLPPTTTVIGKFDTNGILNAVTGSKITQLARFRSRTGGGTVPYWQILPAGLSVSVPTFAGVRSYTGQYTYLGKTYTATKLTATSLSNVTLPYASDLATNPAGVYWTDQNLDLLGYVTVAGTLVVTNGKLNVRGPGITVTASPGLPALVVQSDIDVLNSTSNLTANGLVFTGTGLKTGPLGSVVTVNGGLVAGGNLSIDLNYKGSIFLTYDATKVAVPDFSTVGSVPVGVRVVSWDMK